ncbi:sugar ABC transporter substrate-binding protein [Streptomyces viridochromogenes]|uniref:Sugar ABC transporter substrate-binding protein n=1 Tax=Streptomyces viridochromogenes TaxID=1938 RepID=A0A0J7Z8V7_STRVR|nr:extracellular solute-binding protein [Streptomyces viridochromogenes]KMS71907.1 sugar ABC transporter substrate-binding protein [Streptomyces viridochromogenes]KOG19823.1 sugar ABC transporter substrate-binding protein [Streptomyces viridochromogenes]KOG20549.1 sugar ABC transporter substrate-binding protein [Streptomyces viridochromogenes]
MPGMSRRTVLRSIAAGGAAVAAPGLLTACSTGSGDSDVSNAGKELAPWPTYRPATGPKPDLAATEAGVQAGYTAYPSDLVRSVSRPPGDGSTIKVMSVSFGTPPKPASANRFWAAVENALGVKIEYTIVSQADYQKKMATVMAGDTDTLPDIINLFAGFVLPREAEFVQRRAEDLTPFLSGDAIADYPNLANIPTHAWRDMGRIGGRVYGIPLERPLPGSTLWINQGMFADAGMKEGWTADDFAAVAKRATGGRTYALGAANGSLFGNAVHSAAHNAPQNWAVTKDGVFLPGCADERYKASIAYQARLRKDGSFHPDATSVSQIDLTTLYYNGTVGSMQDGFGAYLPKYREAPDGMTPAAALPYSVGGEPGGIVAARRSFGYTVLKKARKERVEMLLRVLDFLAAPFGSKEWELVHYGVEGTHFTRAKDGSPEPTELGEVENNTNLPLKYLAEGPQVLFVPGMPDAVRALHAWQREVVPHAIRDASFGLQSRTRNAQGTTLKALLDDTVTGIVAGRLPLTEWDAAVKTWRSRGGDRMAEEFAKDHAANA